MLVGTMEISNIPVEIHASVNGSWTIQEPSTEDDEGKTVKGLMLGSADTLDKAVAQARQAISRASTKVNVHFKDSEGRMCVATGIHARNRTLLYRNARGKAEQGSHYHQNVWKPDTPQSEIDEVKSINEDIHELNKLVKEIEAEWKFDVYSAVREAINEATGTKG